MRAAKVWLRAKFTFAERFVVENSCDRAPCRPTEPIAERFYSAWMGFSPVMFNFSDQRQGGITAVVGTAELQFDTRISALVDDSRKWAFYFSKFYPIDMFTRSIYSFQKTNIDQSLLLETFIKKIFQYRHCS